MRIFGVCFTKYHHESKHDKTGVTGMRRHTQTYAVPMRRKYDNINMDIKSDLDYLNLAQIGLVGWLF
jgi:hypothetical protein